MKKDIIDGLSSNYKVYNIWICVEEIDEEGQDNGVDIDTRKIAKFKKRNDAIDFAYELENNNDTPRDKNGFTI